MQAGHSITTTVNVHLSIVCMFTLLLILQILMIVWSYFAAVATDPGEVPLGWHPFSDDVVSTSQHYRLGQEEQQLQRKQ